MWYHMTNTWHTPAHKYCKATRPMEMWRWFTHCGREHPHTIHFSPLLMSLMLHNPPGSPLVLCEGQRSHNSYAHAREEAVREAIPHPVPSFIGLRVAANTFELTYPCLHMDSVLNQCHMHIDTSSVWCHIWPMYYSPSPYASCCFSPHASPCLHHSDYRMK